MGKVIWKAGTFIYPIPAVMVSCGDMKKSNIITVAWTGILNTNPATVYISVRPTRYSYNLIKESKEFVINLTTEKLVKATDWCGVRTGAKFDKFKEMNLHKEKANFGGIAEDIYVSSIVQKTYIDFMESGTKAAAASGAIFDSNSVSEAKSVIFNKPFVYLIRKIGSNNIYFIGTVNNPIEYDETKDVCEG